MEILGRLQRDRVRSVPATSLAGGENALKYIEHGFVHQFEWSRFSGGGKKSEIWAGLVQLSLSSIITVYAIEHCVFIMSKPIKSCLKKKISVLSKHNSAVVMLWYVILFSYCACTPL